MFDLLSLPPSPLGILLFLLHANTRFLNLFSFMFNFLMFSSRLLYLRYQVILKLLFSCFIRIPLQFANGCVSYAKRCSFGSSGWFQVLCPYCFSHICRSFLKLVKSNSVINRVNSYHLVYFEHLSLCQPFASPPGKIQFGVAQLYLCWYKVVGFYTTIYLLGIWFFEGIIFSTINFCDKIKDALLFFPLLVIIKGL